MAGEGVMESVLEVLMGMEVNLRVDLDDGIRSSGADSVDAANVDLQRNSVAMTSGLPVWIDCPDDDWSVRVDPVEELKEFADFHGVNESEWRRRRRRSARR